MNISMIMLLILAVLGLLAVIAFSVKLVGFAKEKSPPRIVRKIVVYTPTEEERKLFCRICGFPMTTRIEKMGTTLCNRAEVSYGYNETTGEYEEFHAFISECSNPHGCNYHPRYWWGLHGKHDY